MKRDKGIKTRTICYVGNFSFPKGNASGLRVLSNGYLFRELGYEVIYFGLTERQVKQRDSGGDCREFDGFKYYEFPYPKSMKDWVRFQQKYKNVVTLIENIDPYAVIAYGSMSNAFFALFLGKWCKARGVKFITDCVDWLAGGSGGIVFRIGKRADTEFQKRYVNTTADGVIVVSNLLKRYYSGRGCKTLVLPPLSRINEQEAHFSHDSQCKDSKISILYAGFPFPTTRKITSEACFKDRLDKSVELLSCLKSVNFVFNIYGITKRDYLTCLPKHTEILELMGEKVQFHGIVGNDEIVRHLSSADYFFLYRDSNKMTNAGFPSKVVESIDMGIPVITTLTSDLDKYIVEGKHGFFLKGTTIAERAAELRQMLTIDAGRLEKMKEHCRKNNPFALEKFVDDAELFINSL